MTGRPLWCAVGAWLAGCGTDARGYVVRVNAEQVCRQFGSAPDNCVTTQAPAVEMHLTIEEETQEDASSKCTTRRKITVVLQVDDRGLSGGEETRTEETKTCNAVKEPRVTRRLREWAGSRDTP